MNVYEYDQLPVGLIAQLVEHCTGIAEVMGSNPVQAWIFFRLSFRNCLSCVVTARIFLLFNLSSAVQIYVPYIYIHLFILNGYITNSQYDQLPVGLIAQLVEHCTGIAEVMGSNPVQAWIFFRLSFRNCLSCVVTARIFLLFDLSSAVQIYVPYIYIHLFILHGYITNSQYDQLPVGLIAQLVEHCTGIAEVMGSNPVQAWSFFRLSFRNCLSCVVTARIFLLFDLSSAVQIYVPYIYI